ncbi:hypothetical protein AEA09_14830 [Lysinibacillus contaminans]|uniref:Uncharacterized protein n=1 Tax=Lysinibacillus contaminans TaxID=1293441 RepID=A0ABR5JYB4_9BACI|nr:hypothetical protein [Lysinibacillus contaminans]KOS67124.1 hypothetical protein AEA09_14830 [Lysinibacillus contaminans]
MGRGIKVLDVVQQDGLSISVAGRYFAISDARQIYNDSKTKEDIKDDSVMIEVRNDKGILSHIIFGAEEGEKFALGLLNICHSIRY